MKKLILTFIFTLGAIQLFAQCKPDQSGKDRITKEEVKIWGIEVVTVSKLMKIVNDQNTTYPTIEAMIGSYGEKYIIRINLIITEKSKERATYATPKEGSENSEILIGFKEGGQPLVLKVNQATNDQKIDKDGNYITFIGLTSNFTKEEILKFKETLTTKTMDGVRVMLSGNKKMEGSIRDKKGEKMKEKFTCFYNTLL